eukprot:TRINITY_DN96631_c0_g1_i1.p1 TRINITY_DN96631_c0_g1~~TRINITY_DN96631_c0_g1_i1.p1  ORF type:complete len:161 (+),score=12.57 TRINITY_DN96631_c0_g1_i1:16-498(+)
MHSPPSILLTTISIGSKILVSHGFTTQSDLPAAVKVLERVHESIASQPNQKLRYSYNKEYDFNFKSEGDYIFMCLCGQAYGRHMPFVFLKDVATVWAQTFKSDTGTDRPVEQFQSFVPILEAKMRTYNGDADFSGETDKLQIGRAVQQECRDRSRMPSSA